MTRQALRLAASLLLSAALTGVPTRSAASATIAAATDAGAPGAGDAAPTGATATLTAPSLRPHPEAAYPDEALAARREGSVGLQLGIDDAGRVTDVRVVSPAGHGFDEAAAATARRFQFDPARRDGAAIASTVQFTYEFHLPPAREPPPPPAAPPPRAAATEIVQSGPAQTTLVLASRPISWPNGAEMRCTGGRS